MIKAIIFDYGYTIYDPEIKGFQPDAMATIKFLSDKFKLILVSRTSDTEARLRQIEAVGFDQLFHYIKVIKKEESKDFKDILDFFKFKPEEFLVVGDRITSEITQGKKLGMLTCRFLYGPEKNLVPENELETPDFTIEKLSDVIRIANL